MKTTITIAVAVVALAAATAASASTAKLATPTNAAASIKGLSFGAFRLVGPNHGVPVKGAAWLCGNLCQTVNGSVHCTGTTKPHGGMFSRFTCTALVYPTGTTPPGSPNTDPGHRALLQVWLPNGTQTTTMIGILAVTS